MSALAILFGAAFTVAVACALGRLLLRRVVSGLYAEEAAALGFIAGSALLSLLVFSLSALHLARKGVFLAAGGLILLAAWRYGSPLTRRASLPPLPRFWRWLFAAGFGAFTVLYFFNAMAPESSPDGVSYHLSFVARYLREHGLTPVPFNMYAQLSQGVEMLFVFAFAFGRHSAAALVHYAFLVALALALLSYGRRLGHPGVGVAASLLFYASPVAGIDGTSAYIDVAAAAIIFAVYYLLQVWDENRAPQLPAIIGLTAGFAYAAKYTAFLAVPYAAAFIWWRARRMRPALLVLLCSLVLIAPWVIKNVVWTGNPFSPLMNAAFPNPVVHLSFEKDWSHQLRSYGIANRWTLPWEIMVSGEKTAGVIGPVFLLLPLALLALRLPAGRRVLAPAVLFTLPYFANVGTRFTLPALPFWSLALALALASYPRILALAVVMHCVLSWPQVLRKYTNPWALNTIPARQALRIEKEESWLSRKHPNYLVARMIEARVPKGGRVLSFDGRAEAYTTRDIAVGFQSAAGEVLCDVFYAGFADDFQPRRFQSMRFPPQMLRRLRIVQAAEGAEDQQWSITELRVLSQGQELERAADWRLSARPNPWDVQLAFDNSPVTRWKTWERFRPGMFVEVDFGRARRLDEVRIESADAAGTVRLEAMDEQGNWHPLPAEPAGGDLPASGFLGKQSMAEIKARGYDYLLIEAPEFGAAEVEEDPSAWGLSEVDHVGAAVLYRIDVRPILTGGR